LSRVRDDEAAELGGRLRAAGFHPLPEVSASGELVGIRLWRLRAGYVEYVALRSNGSGHAVRAEAHYDYDRPFEHGPIVGSHIAYVTAAFDWLLNTALDEATALDLDAQPEAESDFDDREGPR
jgi:hypothetical protein